MNFWMTPQRIYEELTGGPGPGILNGAQDHSYDQLRREEERAFRIQRWAKNIQGGWQGSAADGAYGAAQPLAAAAVEGTQHLYRAQDLLDRQSGSFGRASNSVVPMPAEKPEAGMLDEMLPFDTDTEKQVKAYQADAQHNIQVFEGYDNASSYNENMPREYTITNHSGGTMTVTGGDTGGTIDSDDYRRTGSESGGAGGPGNYSAPGKGNPGGYPGGAIGGAVGSPQPGGSAGSQTSPSEYRPAPAPSYPPGGYPQSPAAHQPGTVPPGGFVPGPVGGYPGGSGRGSGSGGGSGGSGGTGGRGGGPAGGGVGGPGARPPWPGGAAGALAAEEAAARRGPVGGAAAGGRGGIGPMGAPMGAGRGKGDDDEEHTRKVLIEPDPESTFGSDVLTAPQVIGDDAYEE